MLERRDCLIRQRAIERYEPYPKQAEFHAAGSHARERLLMAGNQLGKTYSGGAELAYHMTGEYPDWWEGKRFDRPTRWWAASVTSEVTRDGVQRIMIGEPTDRSQWGTGMLPAHLIVGEPKMRPHVPNAIASVVVKHVSGGHSTLAFKSYDQGREKFQADTLDGIWFDEEPPVDIYFEGLTRTNTTMGIIMLTFTPLKGMSDVVSRYMQDKEEGTHITQMTISDALHYTEEEIEQIIATYPAHEREARVKGIPSLGSGRVFPVPEEDIRVESTPEMEAYLDRLPAIGGIDFGWDHPSAGVELRHDRDADCIYVRRCARMREATPLHFAQMVKPWGDYFPWAWPHDGLQHDKGSGKQLSEQYAQQGMNMCYERATFEDGSNGVEAGVMDMLDRMQTGRWKVMSHLEDWWQEFRLYHRKNGVIVKERDDLMAASRYGLMMIRFAEYKPVPRHVERRIRRIS